MEKPLDLAEGKAEEKKIKKPRSNSAVAAPEFSNKSIWFSTGGLANFKLIE